MGLRERLGETAEKIFIGPQTEGVVEAIKPDSSFPEDLHVLIRTDEGELRHFTLHDGFQLITHKGKIPSVKYVDHSKELKIGNRFAIRTRGTGVVYLFGRGDKDPFNLRPQTP